MEFNKEISEKENMQLVLDGHIPAWLPSFFDACAFAGHVTLGRQPLENGNLIDIFGVEHTVTIDGPQPVNTTTQDFELKDIKKWRDIMPDINLKAIDWEKEADLIRETQVKEGQMINFNAGFVWEQMHLTMGFEEALYSLIAEPEAAFECMNALADFQIEAMQRLYPHLKPELIMFMEHVATARGMLMSPDTYRTVIKPVHKKMYDAIIELGAVPEMHVDGLIEDIMMDYIELGIKVFQPFQVFNDINYYKEKYGVIAMGGWDAIGRGNQHDSTEEEVRGSVRLAMDTYGQGGRYVFFPSGATPRFPQIMEYINDEALSYGMQFYQK
jgi:hypothetical protein